VDVITDELIPKEFRLDQNYPNPFNPTTTIQFAVPVKAEVTLKLFDLLGREVDILVEEEYKPGVYRVLFEAKDLPSAVYFYRIKAESKSGEKSFIRTRKLTLLK